MAEIHNPIRTLGVTEVKLSALASRPLLYFLTTLVAIAVFVSTFPFSGKPRHLHAPHSSQLEEGILYAKSSENSYLINFQPAAPDYSAMKMTWHPQKTLRTIVLLFDKQSVCPELLESSNSERLATLDRCDVPPEALQNLVGRHVLRDAVAGIYKITTSLNYGEHLIRFGGLKRATSQAKPFVLPVKEAAPQFPTLLALSYTKIQPFGLMEQLWGRGKFRFLLYFLGMATLSLAWVSFNSQISSTVKLSLAAALLSLLSLVPHFSGNDETAHFSMLQSAAGIDAESTNLVMQPAYALNVAGRDLMFLDDFFQLHNIYPPQAGTCLHSILGGCGITARPVDFYKIYFPWLTQDAFTSLGVKRIHTWSRLQNGVFFISTLTILIFFLQIRSIHIIPIILIFGGAFSTLLSVSNDVYGINLGLFLSGVQFYIFNNATKRFFNTCLLLFSALLIYLGMKVDSNAYSAVPVVAFTIFYLVVKNLVPRRAIVKTKSALTLIFITTLIALATLQAVRINMKSILNLLLETRKLPADFSLLSHIGNAPLETILAYNFEFLQGLMGRYIWSHTTYPHQLSTIVLIALFLWSLCRFYNAIWLPCKKNQISVTTVIISLCLVGQYLSLALIIEAVASYGATTGAGAWSFLVPRFYYPGIACVFVPILLACKKHSEIFSKSSDKMICFSALLWTTINVAYFFPKFFLADAW